MSLSLDYTFMLSDAVSGGVEPDGFRDAQGAFAAAHAAVMKRHASGELGFFDLPRNRELASSVLAHERELNADTRARAGDLRRGRVVDDEGQTATWRGQD